LDDATICTDARCDATFIQIRVNHPNFTVDFGFYNTTASPIGEAVVLIQTLIIRILSNQ